MWSIDITYIPMKYGFMYLTAIIDVYSRAIMARGLHNTLDSSNSIEVLDEAVRLYGEPEIINSDQGCQYTSKDRTQACEEYRITMSMDGRGRAKDNIWIERFRRTIKMDYIYLNPASYVMELREGISGFIEHYNHRRHHQSLNGRVPWQVFLAVALKIPNRSAKL